MNPLRSVIFGSSVMTTMLIVGAMRARSYRLQCSTKFEPARLTGGARKPGSIHLIVLHSTESTGTAASVASYFQSGSAGGSTQLVVGDDGCFRSVPDLNQPAGAPGANSDGLHIEVVGLAKWSRAEWLEHPTRLDNCARAIAEWSQKYGIPLAFVDAAMLQTKRARGVTTHREVSQAFKQSDHWDPGPGFPLDVVLEKARMYA